MTPAGSQDIKPQNILIDSHDEVVLSDFGISEVVRTQTRIMPSRVKGTFNYMAPEAFDPESAGGIGPPADVWSMGCVMVEMLTGAAPWRAMPMQQIYVAVNQRRRTPSPIRPRARPRRQTPQGRRLRAACS